MKIAVYGAGVLGRYIYEKIKESIIVWVDNRSEEDKLFDIPVLTEQEFVQAKVNVDLIIVAIKNREIAQKVAISLVNSGYDKVYFPCEKMLEAKLEVMDSNGEIGPFCKKWSEIKPILPYLEFQIADKCNLNCKACMHFSNLVKEEQYPDIDQFELCLLKLSEKFNMIEKFRLMGGEPLLNSKLPEFIKLVRKYFPLSDIRVVTNGLGILNISSELILQMNESCVAFDISQYPPTKKKIYDIITFLDKHHIDYYISEPINTFYVRMSKDNQNYEDVFNNACLSKTCTFLRNGYLYVCPHIPMLYEAKEYFEIDIPYEEVASNSIDLLGGHESGWDIISRLQKPFTLCRFCSSDFKEVEWSLGSAKKSDWLV